MGNLIYGSMYAPDGLWLTLHMKKGKNKNKMDKMTSIMVAHNHICEARRGSKGCSKSVVCRNCYSYIQASIHAVIRKKMDENTALLTSETYEPCKIETINNCLRYVSFGEMQSRLQVDNVMKHASKNHHLKKAIWSKMYGYFRHLNEIPKNMTLVWSCSRIDCMNFIIPAGFTKSFYVYRTKETLDKAMKEAKKQGFKTFECQLNCADCLHCYKNTKNTIVFEELRT
jgi:hypothetical protein